MTHGENSQEFKVGDVHACPQCGTAIISTLGQTTCTNSRCSASPFYVRQGCPLCGAFGAHFCTGMPLNQVPYTSPNTTPWIQPGTAPHSPQPTQPWVAPKPVSPSEPPQVRGWICPACGKGNAPFVSQCACEGAGRATTGTRIEVTPTITVSNHCGLCSGTGVVPEGYTNEHGGGLINKPCPNGCQPAVLRNDINEDSDDYK